MDDILYWVYITAGAILSPMDTLFLLDYFGGPRGIYQATPDELKEAGLSHGKLDYLCNKNLKRAEKILELARHYNVRIMCLEDHDYPALLKEIEDPPIVLYVKGDISFLNEQLNIGFVGTRKPTNYGLSTALSLSRELAENDVGVVSGMALGIDSAAHHGALLAKGKTLAVLGCGINVDYPKGNKKLRDTLSEQGAIMTEFTFDSPPLRHHFPYRNRIISGVSSGVVVCEAGERSGSLITATEALAQGRDVFVVPGQIGSAQSVGSHGLINDGAKLLTGVQMILEEYNTNCVSLSRIKPPEKRRKAKRFSISSHKDTATPKSQSTDRSVSTQSKEMGDQPDKPEVTGLLRFLDDTPISIDHLAELADMPISECNSEMTLLAVSGKAKELPGKYYVAMQ